MTKKINDIKKDNSDKKINLRKNPRRENELENERNFLYKKENSIKKFNDIGTEEKLNFSYIKGKKFNPPKFLGNLIKIGIIGFLILLIINVINVYFLGEKIQEEISTTAKEGYNYLIDAGKSATKIQFDRALQSFDKALKNFSSAEKKLWFISKDNSFYAKENDVGQAVKLLLESGKHFTVAGKHFLEAIEEFNKIPLYFVLKNSDKNINPPSITDALKKGLEKTDLAIEEILLASEKIKDIKEDSLPPDIQTKVKFAKDKIAEINKTLQEISKHFPAMLKLLGDRYPHTYLILFQNNNEIRPTGGFIGSYALFDINDGYIENLQTYDVYDLDDVYGEIIEPPDEFKSFAGNWKFRDSNYSPDFVVSAKKARWFLEREGGPTVDTVIAINQGLLRDMLEITGPVQVGDFGKLDAYNYNLLLTFVIESKMWGAEDPKHILKVFVPAFKDAILKEENISKVSSKLYKAILQKHIMMYSSDDEIQALFDDFGVSGRVYQNKEDEDYLSVINISTGGTKTDGFIDETINHHTVIDKYGNIIDEVKITRKHNWDDKIYYEWKKILNNYGIYDIYDYVIDILGRGENKVSTKIYVPKGSILLESNGSDVETKYDKDLKKTYFFTKTNVKAGEEKEIWIKYKLPFTLNFTPVSTYKLIVEKQPGSRGSVFNKTIKADEEIKNIDIYPENPLTDENGNFTYHTNLVYDKYFSSIFKKED